METRRDPYFLSQLPLDFEFYLTPTSKEVYKKFGYNKVSQKYIVKRSDSSCTASIVERSVFIEHYTPWQLTIKRSKNRGVTEYHLERSTGLPRVTRTASYVQYAGYRLEQLFNIINKSLT